MDYVRKKGHPCRPQCTSRRQSVSLEEGMKEVIGELDCELEGRFSELRTRETNLGNLITDIMRRATRADVALINSGTMRSDTIHEAGEFKMKVRNWLLNLRGLLNFHPLTCEARE